MAQVPIPWFTGGQALMGKALRKQRQLQSLTQDMFSVGSLLRAERSQGLPKGATDEDLIDQERTLEAQLGESQDKVVKDATHPHEEAVKAGDDAQKQAVADDPGGYAAGQQAGKDSFLPRLGGFMKTGVERLLWGDPQRAQRVAHITRMKGELEFEKRRMNYAKTMLPMAAASEDPDEFLRQTHGADFGFTHVPKKALTPRQRGTGAGSDMFAPGVAGGATDKEFLTKAYDEELQSRGGKLPEEGDTAGWTQFRDAVMERAIRMKDAHQAGVDKGKRDAANDSFRQHLAEKEKYRKKALEEKNTLTGGGGQTITEKDVPVDEKGNRLTPEEATKRRAQGKTVNTQNIVTRRVTPLTPKDPGTAIGAPPFFAP